MAQQNSSPLSELPMHRDLLERASWHFQGDKRVTGLLLWGSIARGQPDEFSDVDLIAVVPDKQFDAVFDSRDHAATAIGKPLSSYLADHMAGGETQFIILYEGPIQLDLTYRRASEMKPDREWATSHIIKDRDGSLLILKTASERVSDDHAIGGNDLVKLNLKFWNWVWNAYSRIARGELWEALHVINHIRDQVLLQMQDWILEGSLAGYRRTESRLDRSLASKLAETVPKFESADLLRSLRAEIELFGQLREQLSKRLQVTFDNRAERHILDRMEMLTERRRNQESTKHSRK
jgi:predicted nucleotidyltransferase